MSKRRQFTPKLISVGIIDSQLHYGVYARNWWEMVSILSAESNNKYFTIPYRLFMRIGCELNGREFVITVTSNDKNPLKPGFQCICGEFKSEIELYPSTAVKSCYQSIFNSKTEYSGLAIMGFENENIIQQLIADILFFPIFLRIENFLVVITNLGSLPKHDDRENVTMSSYKVDSKTGLPVLYLRDQKCDLWKKFIETYPNGMKKTAFFVRLNNSTNLRYREDLGGLCQTCNDYGYETFENLTNLIYNNFENKNIMASYERELIIRSDGKIDHNPCISHCLLYAFGECMNKHETRCSNCDQLFDFLDFMYKSVPSNICAQITEYKENLLYYLSHQTRKVYLNSQFKTILSELDFEGALFIADYKMRVLPKSARETKQDFFGKRGWTLHTILVFTKKNENEIDISAYDHWSLDIKQDAWFTASAFETAFETLENKPKWIKVISDNGPHYHNSELMAIIANWNECWLFLEPGEAKTIIDSHHAAITHAFKRYLRIGFDLKTGNDIVEAAKGLSGAAIANIEPNRNNNLIEEDEIEISNTKNKKTKAKIKTIKGISKFYFFEWPIEGKYDGYIHARPLPHVEEWSNFTPLYIANLWNTPLHRPQPTISEHTKPESNWTIQINTNPIKDNNEMESNNNIGMEVEDNEEMEIFDNVGMGVEDNEEMENSDNDEIRDKDNEEMENSDNVGIEVEDNEMENSDNIGIGVEDNEEMENSDNVGIEVEDNEMENSDNIGIGVENNEEMESSDNVGIGDERFPLLKGWALKGNQKLGIRGSGNRIKKNVKAMLERFFLNGNRQRQDRMNAQAMRDELMKYVETGEIEEEDVPKINTIQN
ncbi:hypothetical protein Glove_103g290 [Diversispora epigaea]|uniref:Uncharacterized protein n=1 Tax=Diversispora epigaea TaxID=1348612 RepID=A0A397J3E1_9GLOM|nr:hypothetical protein Glove_103g290 [Diversispora epigaea]